MAAVLKYAWQRKSNPWVRGWWDVNKLFLVGPASTVLNHGSMWGCLLQSHLHGPLAGFPVLQEGLIWDQWYVSAQSQIRSCSYSGKETVLAARSTGERAAVLALLEPAQCQLTHWVQQKTSSSRSTIVVFEVISQITNPIWEAFLQTHANRTKSWVFIWNNKTFKRLILHDLDDPTIHWWALYVLHPFYFGKS